MQINDFIYGPFFLVPYKISPAKFFIQETAVTIITIGVI
jgi:hypothetical protein